MHSRRSSGTRWTVALLYALCAFYFAPHAWAQCPAGETCIDSDTARKCLELVESTNADLPQKAAACEAKRNELVGQVNELRLENSQQDERIEKLVGQNTLLEVENRKKSKRLGERTSPFAWASFGACAGAGAAGVVEMATGGPANLLRGGVTVGVGAALCGLGWMLR